MLFPLVLPVVASLFRVTDFIEYIERSIFPLFHRSKVNAPIYLPLIKGADEVDEVDEVDKQRNRRESRRRRET